MDAHAHSRNAILVFNLLVLGCGAPDSAPTIEDVVMNEGGDLGARGSETPGPDMALAAPDLAKRCTGTPTPCSLLGDAQCSLVSGCVTGECKGTASCFEFSTQFVCATQPGCFWSVAGNCVAVRQCNALVDQSSCGGQFGCFWQGCSGTVNGSCAARDATTCANLPGCRVE
jgi:hypothetical protein